MSSLPSNGSKTSPDDCLKQPERLRGIHAQTHSWLWPCPWPWWRHRASPNASPVGTCPSDYNALNQEEVSALPDAELALIAYASVNHNGDDLVCYRAYRNGPHNGGYTGNFIDNTAAPHTG